MSVYDIEVYFVNFSKQIRLIGKIRRISAFYDRSNTLGGHSQMKNRISKILLKFMKVYRGSQIRTDDLRVMRVVNPVERMFAVLKKRLFYAVF